MWEQKIETKYDYMQDYLNMLLKVSLQMLFETMTCDMKLDVSDRMKNGKIQAILM